ncbi:hypothetical protein Q4601_18885 [Shewanella sp. 1_MG-2023]|uniref:hypothetical protein n=1 Tax=unclassified Shewanella TaxID=196818 RepID=UPI0026E2FFC7|nr:MULTISPECIES: hypothetical protein [unclassified Shewanella]MDO6611265.1 hypothetical protein [Shewanella sp. 7_MG-2023]MDO6771120.1 hypothetical protein [Shewanella sp. 2_MG-2023]MDO6796363.1 hypothetical protein [Shewanella sp. 1_MG-2023]
MVEIKECFVENIGVNELVSIGALAIAFLALFVSPLVNARISKRQVIAPMRQAWINALRDKIAEFVSIVAIDRFHISPTESESKTNGSVAHKEDLLRYERLVLLYSSIELHINANEKDHQNLVALLSEIVRNYHDNIDTRHLVEQLSTLTQKILSDEWKATKKT